MSIPLQQARGVFTQMLIDVYRERPRPTSFLRSFFPAEESNTRFLSTEVMRGTEKIAADVLRGSRGNRNEWPRSSQKVFEPPYYKEYFNATDLDFYDRLFGQSNESVSENEFNRFLNMTADKLADIQDLIERSHELQCAQALQTGIILLNASTNIDWKRKAESMVDVTAGGGVYWSDPNATPIEDIRKGCEFLRTQGKVRTGVFNLILGNGVLDQLTKVTEFKERADFRHVELVDISMPTKSNEAIGGVFHGEISADSYRVRVWSYPEFYEDDSENLIPYIDENKAILLPDNPRFKFGFGAVPMVMRDSSRAEFPEYIQDVQGQFVVNNHVDAKAEAHEFTMKSAGLAILTAVNQVFTLQVLA